MTTVQKRVLPRFGNAALRVITNSCIRQWVSYLLASGLSAATTGKAVFALRHCLDAVIADNRLQLNPAMQCFFAFVEQRDKPSLRGKPVVVGGLGRTRHASSAYGSAMPMDEARHRCTRDISRQVRCLPHRKSSDARRATQRLTTGRATVPDRAIW